MLVWYHWKKLFSQVFEDEDQSTCADAAKHPGDIQIADAVGPGLLVKSFGVVFIDQ